MTTRQKVIFEIGKQRGLLILSTISVGFGSKQFFDIINKEFTAVEISRKLKTPLRATRESLDFLFKSGILIKSFKRSNKNSLICIYKFKQ
jgi:hypothetical protein